MSTKEITPHLRGGSWQVRWRENGKQPSASFTTREIAWAFIARLHANNGQGLELLRNDALNALQPAPEPLPVAPNDRSQQTVTQLCHEYIELISKASEEGKKTLRLNIDNHIDPYIGHLQAREITGRQILTEWQIPLLTKPARKGKRRQLKPKSIKNYRGDILVPAMSYATGMSMDGHPAIRPDNPVLLVPPVKVPEFDKQTLLSEREAALFCQAAYDISQPWGDLLSLQLAGLFRPGEAVALRARVANRDHQSLYMLAVRRKGTIVDDAKTAAGYGREVPIPTPVWKEIVMPWIERGGTYRHSLIVPDPSGNFWNQSTQRNLFERTVDKATEYGLFKDDMTPRNMRDSMAGALHRQGFSGLPLKKVMGHVCKDITDGYAGGRRSGKAVLTDIERAACLAAGEPFFSQWRRG